MNVINFPLSKIVSERTSEHYGDDLFSQQWCTVKFHPTYPNKINEPTISLAHSECFKQKIRNKKETNKQIKGETERRMAKKRIIVFLLLNATKAANERVTCKSGNKSFQKTFKYVGRILKLWNCSSKIFNCVEIES